MSAFTVINQNAAGFDPANVANALLGTGTGMTFDPASFQMVSGASSAAFYDGSLALGIGAGLLITSGTMPGTSNTAGYFGISNGMAGDPMLDAVVNTVFPTVSYDATTISFSFTVTDPSITGVSFNIVFGSDEYPEWVNQFVDVGAIWVNGSDVAYFNNDPNAPLSVIGSNLSANYFINNTGNLTTSSFGGVALPGVPSLMPIEYDGVSAPLTVFAPVHQGVNTLKIGIADTGDHIYDSGLFISNMLGTSIPVSGITRDIDGTESNDLLQGTEDPENLRGQGGNDDIRGAGGNDVLQGGDGDDFLNGGAGNDVLEGGAGIDVAVYNGNLADYTVIANADGSYTIEDQRAGAPDGTDTLLGVEVLQFADVAVDPATMIEQARHEAPLTTAPASTVPTSPPLSGPVIAATPVVSGPVTASATEDGAPVSVSLLANATDSNPNATLTITGLDGASAPAVTEVHGKAAESTAPVIASGTGLPAGVTFDPATGLITLDPSDPAFQSLSAGQTTTLTINYGVSDGIITTPGSAVFTLTGTNDAPVVSGPVFASATEGFGSGLIDRAALLANASDVDTNDTLTIVVDDQSLPAGVIYNHVPGTTTVTAISYYGVSFLVPATTVDTFELDSSNAAYDSLAQGETLDLTVTYGVSDGTVTTPAQAVFHLTGSNDAPVVSAPVTASATERGSVVTVSAFANATDVDHGTVFSVSAVPAVLEGESFVNGAGVVEAAPALPPLVAFDPATLPAGVTFDPATNSFSLDPNDPAYLGLTGGQVVTVTVNYGVSDGIAATAAQAVFTVTGTNAAPSVVGTVATTVHEDGGAGILTRAQLLGNVTDPDGIQSDASFAFNTLGTGNGNDFTLGSVGDRMSIQFDELNLPEGVSYHHTDGQVTATSTSYYGFSYTVQVPTIDTLTLDSSDPAYQSLADGEQLDITVPYTVSDGTTSVANEAVFHLIGTNDAPVISAPVAGAATEDAAPVTIDGLANATDVDHGAILSVVAPPPPPGETENFLNGAGVVEGAAPPPPPILPFDSATLPAGVTFDPATNSFTLDPADPAYQSLAAGQTTSVTVTYGVSDGIIATAATATFTVTGTNDAPVASGPVTGLFVNEDGQSGAYDLPALLSTTSDVDQGDKLAVIVDPASLPAGVTYVSTPESVIPGHTIPAFVIPAGPRGTSWGAYVYPAQFVPAQVVPDQIVPATSKLSIDPSDPSFQSLAEGEEGQIVVHYQVTDGLTAIPVDAILTVNGMNDAPVVSAPVSGAATEGGATVTLDGLANASDVDHGTTLHVMGAPLPPVLPAIGVGPDSPQDLAEATALAAAAPLLSLPFDPTTLPAGVTYDPAAQTFTLDPTDPAYQSLSLGQTKTVTINYGVSDGITTTAAKAVFTVTGTNDAPIVGSTPAFAAAEDSAAITLNPLGNVTDVDQLDVLKVVAAPLPAGIQLVTVPGAYYQPPVTITTFNPADASFQSLAAGETQTVVWNYTVTDGHDTVADSASFTVTGVNDAPMQTGFMGAVVTEDGAAASANGLSGMVDVDHGSVISMVNVPALLPAGVTFDAATNTFSIDPANAAYQVLAQGEVQTVSVAYGVTDGLATSSAHVDFTVIGTNDAPVVTGPTTGTPNEDGAVVSVKALGNASDIDGSKAKDGLHVTGVPATLPAGVTYDAVSKSFNLDPTNAAYQSLSLGETTTVSIGYSVSDGYVDVPTSVIFTVTGRNDAPTVSGAVQGGSATTLGAPVTMNLVSTASDIDHLDTLNVNLIGGNKVTASVTSGTWAAPIAFSVVNNQLTVDPKQFAALGLGKSVGITFNYTITDGNPGGTAPASATLTVQGANSGPTGVAFTSATASLAKAQSGSSINSKTQIATVAETGGIATDSYTYALGGTGAASFALATSSGTTSLQTGTSPATGAAGGKLYALNVTATDTTAGLSSPAIPVNVVVGQGSGTGTINLAGLPSMVASTPTFVYDLGGSDQINGSGMTGKLLIDGGQGADVMTGGSGANTYLYGAATDSTVSSMDIITTFNPGADLIDLTGLGTKLTSIGALPASATTVGATSASWQVSGGNTFLYVNTTNKAVAFGSATMKMELLGTPALTAGNIAHL